jgi:pimeloyl-ACP methyl ester carboxylesterase
MRSQLPCSRERILFHLSSQLFGSDLSRKFPIFASLLAKCLDEEYILGSIASQIKLGVLKGSDIPTLVINGNDDFVIDRMAHTRWSEQLKPGDHYRAIKNARHFFHHQEANQTADVIESFLDMVPEEEMNNSLTIKSDYSPIQISKND